MQTSPFRSTRRANIAVVATLMVGSLFGVGAVGVELASAEISHAQLQAVADAACVAAAMQLDGTSEGLRTAGQAAADIGQQNGVFIDREHLHFGVWTQHSATFAPTVDPTLANAVRLTRTQDGPAASIGTTLFAADGFEVGVHAIATIDAEVVSR